MPQQHKAFTIPIDPAKATSTWESLIALQHVGAAANTITVHDQTTKKPVFKAELQALITPIDLPDTMAEEEVKRILLQHVNEINRK